MTLSLLKGRPHVSSVEAQRSSRALLSDSNSTTNVRHISADDIGGRVDIVVGDLSFISLTLVIPALVSVCQPDAPMVMLVKPQFEAGRSEVGKGRGIITDPVIHERVKGEVADAFVAAGCSIVDWAVSPITGADGNVEFLVWVSAPSADFTDFTDFPDFTDVTDFTDVHQ